MLKSKIGAVNSIYCHKVTKRTTKKIKTFNMGFSSILIAKIVFAESLFDVIIAPFEVLCGIWLASLVSLVIGHWLASLSSLDMGHWLLVSGFRGELRSEKSPGLDDADGNLAVVILSGAQRSRRIWRMSRHMRSLDKFRMEN